MILKLWVQNNSIYNEFEATGAKTSIYNDFEAVDVKTTVFTMNSKPLVQKP